MTIDVRAINDLVQRESAFIDGILQEVRKVVVGQEHMIERVLIGLLTGGHVLLEGVPGLAKTLTVNTICQTVSATFSRIQFTPDLLPADVVGTVIYNQQSGQFTAKQGPIFANLVLADEINRAPAKVQSALLEAMQELQVTIGDQTHKLEAPFMVMATQNPVEQEGTYPLAEAQVDRFMLHVTVDYPTPEEERTIMERMASHVLKDPSPAEEAVTPDPLAIRAVATPRQLLEARRTIGHVYMDEKIKDYIIDVVTSTRDPQRVGLGDLRDMIAHGASPRASIALNVAARAHAFLKHRGYVTPEDVKAVGHDVLRHRIIRTYEAEAEEITSEHLVRRIFEAVEVP
ncbi:MAG TPA: MoxR family ATPase [Polyangiaceae bacterium LLY-WYZ-15_(1-7)]|nr:ATPase [Sandaracinus sp.]HJK95468.1 MoxR family ATPase [Polyangiaceae bacterium LLY-WYZ-15_(1-7)]HJL01969.1 MoxR family ATPase [Polyangiaceae bacterium LLY-WYZ-15_(1-7)]HJL07983.1 MoxR family ATPase [Polyangiaceae bacterium LLY-WYZ-15_(1-7)]HJL28450.1 MoxR family ATPase [Polyangiaceae bacterium LLY-WYZ-15_(1-7)]